MLPSGSKRTIQETLHTIQTNRMNRKIITLLLLTIFTNFGYAQSDKINIKTEHLTEANYLKIDSFYLTHYLYIDLFLRENLFPEASLENVSAILKALKNMFQ